jgi:adenine C2-methylase RlmN of 23S rRNA A2503 and tRNA A37
VATDLVRKRKVGNGSEIYLYDVKRRRARRLTKFGKQIDPDLFSDAHRPYLDPRGRRVVFRYARYSLVDDDFEEADRVLIVRAR